MFKLYSKGCEYAIRALIFATDHSSTDSPKRFQAKDVCEKAGIPESFTRKILQALVQDGVLVSGRGPGGGYALAMPAEEISIARIIRAIDGDQAYSKCVMGLEACNADNPCPMHDYWTTMKVPMLEELEARTLKDLLRVSDRYRNSALPTTEAEK